MFKIVGMCLCSGMFEHSCAKGDESRKTHNVIFTANMSLLLLNFFKKWLNVIFAAKSVN
jgi:hypothetical protein